MSVNPFTQALGENLDALPEPIKDHFGIGDGTRHYRGTMARVWRRSGVPGLLAVPAMWLASAADMLFSETGRDVGFSLSHRVQQDEGGPTMVWSRQFHFPKVTRRFDAVMQYSAERGCIVDWLGGTGGLEVELHPQVIERGIEIVSGKQWLRLGRANLPLPGWIAGKATIREWIDEDENQRIQVTVNNPLLGDFFGYEGTFAEVANGDAPEVPTLPIPKPGIVVPVLRWFLLALVAIAGTVVVAGSFVWTNAPVLQDMGVAVGVGAGVAWVGFGAALLVAARQVPAVTWVDMCLRTMTIGMAVLASIFILNLLLRKEIVAAGVSPMVYVGIVALSDVGMAIYFSRNARRYGVSWWRSLTLWVLALNGLCVLMIAAWLRLVD